MMRGLAMPTRTRQMNASFFGELLQAISERGRAFMDRTRERRGLPAARSDSLIELCEELLSGRGEASGVALAREILLQYAELTTGPRIAFFEALATKFGADRERIAAAVAAWEADPSESTAAELHAAAEPRRQELFRRLNLAPSGTTALVAMREQLMDALARREDLAAVDADFVHLFSSWFNRGFLVLRRIDWSTPAIVLEKLIRYEAVHEIRDWNDLRRRIDPPDRRCFAFFHPAPIVEPLVFLQGALSVASPAAIAPILTDPRRYRAAPRRRPRDPRPRASDHRDVLFDLQLPARADRRHLRELPDQAGGRGDLAGAAAAFDLRHALAGAGFYRLARSRARERAVGRDQSRGPRAARPARSAGLVARAGNRRSPARAGATRRGRIFPRRAHPARHAARPGCPVPSRQRRAARADRLARRYVGEGFTPVARPDGELPLRPRGDRAQSRGLCGEPDGRGFGHDPQARAQLDAPPAACFGLIATRNCRSSPV